MSAVEHMVTREFLAQAILLKLLEEEASASAAHIAFYGDDGDPHYYRTLPMDVARHAVLYADALLAELAKRDDYVVKEEP